MILSVLTISTAILVVIKSFIVLSEVMWLRKANLVIEEIWIVVKKDNLSTEEKSEVEKKHHFFHSAKRTISERLNISQATIAKYLRRILKIRPLIFILSGIMFLQESFPIFWIGSISLILGILSEILYMYYYSPILGYARGQMEKEAISKGVNIIPTKYKKTPPTFIGRRKFIRDYFILLFFVMISFGGTYSGIYHIDNSQFSGVCKESYFLDLLYFSVVTMTTVGFGDISPNGNYWIPKVFVSLQIISSFLLIVGMISVISIKGNQNE